MREPQRQRGRDRVAALLQAGAAVFAEKGYEAATMTEVAARAGASIGSLYQFFPSKEALADALLAGYGEQVLAGLQAVEAQAARLAVPDLADALIDLLVGLKQERVAALALIEARRDAVATAQPLRLRDALRAGVARILALRAPGLPPERATAMAIIVLLQMKAAAALGTEPGLTVRAAALAELRRMTRLYLAEGLDQA
ncbi:helix-turn-helix domain-containing protein [Inquilinus sp.]|uniref:helix-turn-helix domain-containing protein n=1 Tax=Inquilinus sp. TaxID=1932117 RepID=UPI0031E08DF6